MLKFTLFLISLTLFCSNWNFILNGLIFLCFLFLVKYHHLSKYFELSSVFGLDYISYTMIMLSFWIIFLAIFASQTIKKTKNLYHGFLLMNILLCLALALAFSSMNLLLFYIMFESSLIPMLILILGWGYQPERIQAGIYMLFYTLTASLPLLLSILFIYQYSGSLTFNIMEMPNNLSYANFLWYFSSITAFLVKLPMFFFHLWLPKAHVEAPVAGSMILAGVLLKLGGYGLIRILPLMTKLNKIFSWLWVSIGLVGGILISLMCLRQSDMKALIAYSSVAHMSMVLCGIIMMYKWSISGSLIVMIGHGLCSSGLFCIANMTYSRLHSRSLFINKGLLTFMPALGLWWFLLSVSNMAAPPTLNLLGEISLIISTVAWNKITLLGLSLLAFFSASYTLYMYSLSQHGVFYSSTFAASSGNTQEFLTLFLHWLPLNILILKSFFMLQLFY